MRAVMELLAAYSSWLSRMLLVTAGADLVVIIISHLIWKKKHGSAKGKKSDRREQKQWLGQSRRGHFNEDDDAMDDIFDTAMIISADSDLVPPVEAVRARFPAKRIIIASPPARHSTRLAAAANACFTIGRKKLQDSQLPDQIIKPDGFVLARPASWT